MKNKRNNKKLELSDSKREKKNTTKKHTEKARFFCFYVSRFTGVLCHFLYTRVYLDGSDIYCMYKSVSGLFI